MGVGWPAENDERNRRAHSPLKIVRPELRWQLTQLLKASPAEPGTRRRTTFILSIEQPRSYLCDAGCSQEHVATWPCQSKV